MLAEELKETIRKAMEKGSIWYDKDSAAEGQNNVIKVIVPAILRNYELKKRK